MKICPICRAQFETKAQLAGHMATHQGGRGGGKRRGGSGSVAGGTSIHLARSEYIGSSRSLSLPLQPGKTGCRQLDNMAAVFELYRWEKVTIQCRPTVGSNQGGQCFVGFSYEADHIPTQQTDIAACSPSTSSPVARDVSLSCPVKMLMGAPWLSTSAKTGEGSSGVAGYACMASDQNMGVWLNYSVTLSGPTSVQRDTVDRLYAYSRRNAKWEEDSAPMTELPASDVPASIELELDTNDTTVVSQVLASLKSWLGTFVEAHRVVVDGITFIHGVVDRLSRVAPVALPVAAVIHQRRLLFRPHPRLERGCK